jgi:F0F1-type ATP synthase assembly protein I
VEHPEGGPNQAIGEGYAMVAVGITFALTLTGAALLGFWLDKRFGTVPLFTLIGTLGGMTLAGYWLWAKLVREQQKREDR